MFREDRIQVLSRFLRKVLPVHQKRPAQALEAAVLLPLQLFERGSFFLMLWRSSLRNSLDDGIGVRFVLTCLREANNTENLLAELGLHVETVINDLRIRKMLSDEQIVGSIHIHRNSLDTRKQFRIYLLEKSCKIGFCTSSYYVRVVLIDRSPAVCYTVWDAVDWLYVLPQDGLRKAPTTAPLQFVNQLDTA